MTERATLNSRLRVLVAKSFRAEKLYSSMRNRPERSSSNPALLSEMANDLRAEQWQRSHAFLRKSLNEILSLGSGGQMAERLLELYRQIQQRANEHERSVLEGADAMNDTVKRGEFVHALKCSFELIRHRAAQQAYTVILDELSSIIDVHSKNAPGRSAAPDTAQADAGEVLAEDMERQIHEVHIRAVNESAFDAAMRTSEEASRTNVIPLTRTRKR